MPSIPASTARDMSNPPLLEVAGLEVRFGDRRVVDRVSFSIGKGESLVLLGESGSGKSTIALSLMRLLPEPAGRVTGGRIVFEGADLLRIEERRMRGLRGHRMGMVFQEPQSALNPVETVGRQLEECLPRHGRRLHALRLLESVGLPDPKTVLRSYPHQLSGGMRQRAVIAMALAREPALLIADEPTSALDVTVQAQILDLIRQEQRRREMAVLFVTHDLAVAKQVADRVAVLYQGEIVEQAPREVLFRRPRHPYTLDLFAAVPAWDRRGAPLATGGREGQAGGGPGCPYAVRCRYADARCRDEPPLAETREETEFRCHHPPTTGTSPRTEPGAPSPETATPLLAVRALSVDFLAPGRFLRPARRVRVVHDIALQVSQGQTLALVGESGSGKTTIGRAILRLVEPASGSLWFDGVDLRGLRGEGLRRQRRDIQMIFQDPYASLNPRMTASAIVEEGLRAQGIVRAPRARVARAAELLEQVGVPANMVGRYPHQFSGGQRQRIAIARALALEPRLIVCDEPTSALDVSVQAQILNLLRRLQDQLGLAYLFITHNLAVVEYLAHEIAILHQGRIVEYGSAEQVLKRPRDAYTRALLAAVPRL